MKETVGDRITKRLEFLGISQAELARRVHLAQSTINGLINGGSRGSTHLPVIARELGVSAEWLGGLIDLPTVEESSAAQRLDVALLPELTLAQLEMLADGAEGDWPTDERRAFPRDWIAMFTDAAAEGLFLVHNTGDGMAPTLTENELLLVDRSNRAIAEQDRIWALVYGGAAMIRRVRVLAGGKLELLCDNPHVPPLIVRARELNVIGRVDGSCRRL